MKYRKTIILLTPIILLLGIGITYSIFTSSASLNSADQGIAKFIFNDESLEQLQLPLMDLYPGSMEEYEFSITNAKDDVLSEVIIEYQIAVKTYHFIPLEIELFKITEDGEEALFTCNESYTRNDDNQIVCNTDPQELGLSKQLDNYKLKVTFPSDYDDLIYANLVDFISLDVNSWQKISD